jgi:8-oxo-dGTP diphosphatase
MAIINGVGVVVEDNGSILLGQRASGPFSGQWCLPGGKIDQGESVEQCAKRELFEETGLEARGPVTVMSLSAEIDPDKDFHSLTFGTFVRSIVGDLSNPEPHKFSSWRWYQITELPEALFLPTKNVLQAYVDWHDLKLPPIASGEMRPGEFRKLFRNENRE